MYTIYIKLRQQVCHHIWMLPKVTHNYQTWNPQDLATYQNRTNIFKYSFFSYSIVEWNKHSSSTQNSTYPVFQNNLLKIMQPVSNPVYNTENYNVMKLLTRLWLGLRHFNEHRFNYNLQNCINLLYMYLQFRSWVNSKLLLVLSPLP